FFHTLKGDFSNWILVIFLLLSYAVRLAAPRFKKLTDTQWLWVHSFIVGSHAVAWSVLLVGNILHNPNRFNELMIFTYIIFAGLSAAASYTLSMSKKDFYFFVTPILATQTGAFYLNDYGLVFQITGSLVVLVFFAFLAFQREQAEKSWIEQRTLNFELQNIIDAVPGGISVIRANNYYVINKYIESLIPRNLNLIGCEPEEFLGKDPTVTEKMIHFIKSPETRSQYETNLNVNGENRTHLVTAVKSLNDETIISTIDIHELKKIELEMNRQKMNLQHSSKMASLGEMSGGLAHEINNPVAIISGRAQQLLMMLQKDNISKEVLINGLENISTTTKRIDRIIKGLRSFSRDTEIESHTEANLKNIIEDTLTFCEAKFKNFGIDISYTVSEEINIECGPTQISQVLLNALNNSYDAIIESNIKWIKIEASETNNEVRIQITDSGNGIPEHLRDKVMQPFFSTKEIGKGTGLGLSISKGIMEAHKGQFYINHESTNTQLVMILPKKNLVK
ncbi:MAG: HAMP domain-containing sensor histidine kinase, partial [Pseudobdellovibrio sp.]